MNSAYDCLAINLIRLSQIKLYKEKDRGIDFSQYPLSYNKDTGEIGFIYNGEHIHAYDLFDLLSTSTNLDSNNTASSEC